jgi:hypothetical protein
MISCSHNAELQDRAFLVAGNVIPELELVLSSPALFNIVRISPAELAVTTYRSFNVEAAQNGG